MGSSFLLGASYRRQVEAPCWTIYVSLINKQTILALADTGVEYTLIHGNPSKFQREIRAIDGHEGQTVTGETNVHVVTNQKAASLPRSGLSFTHTRSGACGCPTGPGPSLQPPGRVQFTDVSDQAKGDPVTLPVLWRVVAIKQYRLSGGQEEQATIKELEKVGVIKGFPGGANGKESACQCRRCKRCEFDPWVGKIPWSRKWQPAPAFLPGKSHGQRSLEGYSPWSHKRVRQDWSDLARLLHEGDPCQGPKLGSCLTLGNDLSEETCADKARGFIGKGCLGGEH